ncbi:MAG TPA: LytR C-terminal domain-containing protein, partial [Gemmatimonadaceae bacterium]|nr:LytR C-terminal domain-containing protein [Gemmatimonadaceae bacterium]
MKTGRWILVAAVLAGAGIFGWKRYPPANLVQWDPVPEVMVPPGVRIKVEVLNATGVRGLARKATMFLRDRGFDVVAVGTAREQRSA